MKTKSIYSILALSMILGACTMEPEQSTETTRNEAPVETVYTYMETSEGAPVARMMIAGMSCEQMCGSRIKAAVSTLPGVIQTDLAFHTEGEVDTLTVIFDPKMVNERDMVNAVMQMQGGTYQVMEVQLSKEAKTSYIMEGDSGLSNKHSDYNRSSAEKLSIPNIFDALRRVSV